MVLRGGTDHRRSADVDLLDRFGAGHVRAGHRGLEGIEVADDQIDRADLVRLHVRLIFREFATGENATMNFRVQRLHSATEHLGAGGQLGHVEHRNAGVSNRACRPARGHELYAQLIQLLREFNESRLVRHGKQRAGHRLRGITGGHRFGLRSYDSLR